MQVSRVAWARSTPERCSHGARTLEAATAKHASQPIVGRQLMAATLCSPRNGSSVGQQATGLHGKRLAGSAVGLLPTECCRP